MTPSKILFYLCVSFVVGIFISSIFKMPQIFVWGILIIAILIVIASLFLKKDDFIVIGFCLAFLVLGVLRFQISEFNIAKDKLAKLNGQEVVLTGIVSNEPDVREKIQKLKVRVDKFESTVLVTTNKYPEYKYLDKVEISGKLETPEVFDDFNYKNYLLKDHIYSVMDFPKIEKLDRRRASIFSYIYSGILWLKQKIRQSIEYNFSPPQSSILTGTVLGDNGAMTNDLKNKLNITGLRHIIAVSGTHVVILSSIVMSLLLAMGFDRGKAFYIAIIFIFLYIVLTGLPSSGVRAGIMGGLYLLAQKLGRQSMGSRVIVMACAIMLIINPLLLLYDVGFQLSFLAVMGLIYLEPFIKSLIKKVTKDKIKDLVGIVSTTFAAQIFTLPIMVYNFGNISFVSPITNLLILPIVYWLMIFGFLTSVAGVFSNVLGWVLSLPCWFLLTYFVKIMDFFSQPWAVKTVVSVHWAWLVMFYLLLTIFIVWIKRYNYNNNYE